MLLGRLYEELRPCAGRVYVLLERVSDALLFTVDSPVRFLTAERCGRTEFVASFEVTTLPEEFRTVLLLRELRLLCFVPI